MLYEREKVSGWLFYPGTICVAAFIVVSIWLFVIRSAPLNAADFALEKSASNRSTRTAADAAMRLTCLASDLRAIRNAEASGRKPSPTRACRNASSSSDQ
jgi:hypothetical protein